jgi:hypothetical protein
MTNRRNQIEIENVHNLIHHVEIESLFVFFQNFNRTVLIQKFEFWPCFELILLDASPDIRIPDLQQKGGL